MVLEDKKEEGLASKKIYSHSRLWLYESCPEAYKIKYIDKKFPDIPKSINLFLGSIVHESLEWLYNQVKECKSVELDELIKFYAQGWKNQMGKDVRIGKGEEHYYFNKGIKFLIDYFQKNKPFEDNTVHIEKKIFFPLDENKEYFIQGYVDRIVFNNQTEEYEVHDYKTNEFMKTQNQVDSDRQLAFYHLGLDEIFGKQEKVKLIWHFLAHNKTISSRRNREELEELKKQTLELIKKIESTTIWNSCGKNWCDWCQFKRANTLDRYL